MSNLEVIYDKYRRDGLIRTIVGMIFRISGEKKAKMFSGFISKMLRHKIKLHGVVLYLDNNIIGNEIIKLVLTAAYESEERFLIDKYLQEDIPVIELGGGIGFISCYISNKMSGSQKQVVVEADENLIPIIENNMCKNNVRFDIINKCYHPTADYVNFSIGEIVTVGRISDDASERRPAISLSEISSTYDISDFNLICDIEGEEIELVNEEHAIIKNHCKLIIMETHGNISKIESKLQNIGFKKLDEHANVIVYKNSD